jgi:hypothetical protein
VPDDSVNSNRESKKMTIQEIASLFQSIKADIADDYRADEFDEKPGIAITVSTDDGKSWNYQTGDNSFTGSCYGDRHWHTTAVYRDSNCRDLARACVNELRDTVAEERENQEDTVCP